MARGRGGEKEQLECLICCHAYLMMERNGGKEGWKAEGMERGRDGGKEEWRDDRGMIEG